MVQVLAFADVLMLTSFILRFQSLPPQLPLLYSKPWGEEQLADSWFIFVLPLALHIFFFLNIYIYRKFFFPDHFIRKIILTSNISVTVVFTFIFLKILFYIS